MKRTITFLAALGLLTPLMTPAPVQAAAFTKTEVKQIHRLQRRYQKLTQNSGSKLYQKKAAPNP